MDTLVGETRGSHQTVLLSERFSTSNISRFHIYTVQIAVLFQQLPQNPFVLPRLRAAINRLGQMMSKVVASRCSLTLFEIEGELFQRRGRVAGTC